MLLLSKVMFWLSSSLCILIYLDGFSCFHQNYKTYKTCTHLYVLWKEKNSNGLLGLSLWNHIIHNPLDMNFISLLNTIEECLMAPHIAFAILKLKGYNEYGIHVEAL